MIGAGGPAGQGDAANLLKPALARGELRTIAATTWAEYKKYFEKDAALARRFQVVKVEEPTEEVAIVMMRGARENAREAPRACASSTRPSRSSVKLSHRYISGRQLPDKCVSVLDTACARVAIGQTATPARDRGLPAPDRPARRPRSTSSSARRAAGADHGERLAEGEGSAGPSPRPGSPPSTSGARRRRSSSTKIRETPRQARGGRRRRGTPRGSRRCAPSSDARSKAELKARPGRHAR